MTKKPVGLAVRCPLCVQQKITVAAEAMSLTNNGVGAAFDAPTGGINMGAPALGSGNGGGGSSSGGAGGGKGAGSSSKSGKSAANGAGKATTTVLKWGGGHAGKKKKDRKLSKIPCKFGADCKLSACFFKHPGGGGGSGQQVV